MKKSLLFYLFVFCTCAASSQQRIIDSIKQLMPSTNDTLMLVWSSLIGQAYVHVDDDSVPVYYKQYLALCKKLNLSLQEADALMQASFGIAGTNPANAIDFLYSSQNIIEHPANKNMLPATYLKMLRVSGFVTTYEQYKTYLQGRVNLHYGYVYFVSNRSKKAIDYLYKALKISRLMEAPEITAPAYLMLGAMSDNNDSSLYYLHKSHQICIENDFPDKGSNAESFLAQTYASKKDIKSEFFYRQSALQKDIQQESFLGCRLGLYWNGRLLSKKCDNKRLAIVICT
jgi:hypothetical protein